MRNVKVIPAKVVIPKTKGFIPRENILFSFDTLPNVVIVFFFSYHYLVD